MNNQHPELQRYLQEHPQTTHVDVLLIDLCGKAIGKRLPVDDLPGLFDKGSAVCAAMQLVDAMGNTADPMGYGFTDGDPDAYAMPIAGTLCPVPWLTGNKAQVMCEFAGAADGKPLWYEPRQVLKSVLARFDEFGVTPRLALELEFYLLDAQRDDYGSPRPANSPLTGITESSGQVLSLDKLDEFEPVELESPVTLDVRFKNCRPSQVLAYLPIVERTDAHSIRYVGEDMVAVSMFLEFMLSYDPSLEP